MVLYIYSIKPTGQIKETYSNLTCFLVNSPFVVALSKMTLCDLTFWVIGKNAQRAARYVLVRFTNPIGFLAPAAPPYVKHAGIPGTNQCGKHGQYYNYLRPDRHR